MLRGVLRTTCRTFLCASGMSVMRISPCFLHTSSIARSTSPHLRQTVLDVGRVTTGLCLVATAVAEECGLVVSSQVPVRETDQKVEHKQPPTGPSRRPLTPPAPVPPDYYVRPMDEVRERRVPTTRVGRLWHFGGLAAGVAWGALGSSVRRTLGGTKEGAILSTEANARRIAETLCRMRGAALKLGQMISMTDETLLPPEITDVLDRMRRGADVMPSQQMEKVIAQELGQEWRSLVRDFETTPIAAASIGQVHAGTRLNGERYAMKVQYPGVADSIDSDLDNLRRILVFSRILPSGLFLDDAIQEARKELKMETDYIREADNTERFGDLLEDDVDFAVPRVIRDLSTRRVLTTELMEGIPVESICKMNQEIRNWFAERVLQLCLRELFEWRFMQTDPNWSNFFYEPTTHRVILLDFGSCRDFSKHFTNDYLHAVYASANKDVKGCLDYSIKLGFLTGDETDVMLEAHAQSMMIVGEPFSEDAPFDFSRQDVTHRIQKLVPTMLKYRLKSPLWRCILFIENWPVPFFYVPS